jgi:hypothetical protein
LCQSLSSEIKEPYLRAMFVFISSRGNFSALLDQIQHGSEKGFVPFRDRLAIALWFLPDDEVRGIKRNILR